MMFLLRISGTRGFCVFLFYFLKHWGMLMFMKGKFRVLWHCYFHCHPERKISSMINFDSTYNFEDIFYLKRCPIAW